MGRKLLITPRSKIRAILRQLTLRSRERANILKDAEYRCARCNIKQSKAKGKEVKIEVHHKSGVKWDEVIDLIYKVLLNQDDMECLCEKCHALETEKQKAGLM